MPDAGGATRRPRPRRSRGLPAAVTITGVAELAGVSRATVSRVMNDSAAVRPELADRVRRAIEELGYTPNGVAQSLARGRTGIVAIVVPDLANPMFQAVLGGVSTAASADGHRLLVADSRERVEEEAVLAVEARRRCDGLVLCAPRMPAKQLRSLLPRLAPTVLVNRRLEVSGVPTVAVDHGSGMRRLCDHLVRLGHGRIGYLSGPPTSSSDRERLEALRASARRRRFELVEIPCGSSFADGHAAAEAVPPARVTAVVAYNDLVAFGAMSGLHELGLRIPGDISIAGFDDIPFARYTNPPLTTMSVPQDELGQIAWARLFALLRHQAVGADICFTPRLEIRGSTAPPG